MTDLQLHTDELTPQELQDAAKKIFESSSEDFYKIKNEKWYQKFFHIITQNRDGKKYLIKDISSLAQLQEIFYKVYIENFDHLNEEMQKIVHAIIEQNKMLAKLYAEAFLRVKPQKMPNELSDVDKLRLALFLGEYKRADGSVSEEVQRYNLAVLESMISGIPSGIFDPEQLSEVKEPEIIYRCFLEQCAVDGTLDSQEWAESVEENLDYISLSPKKRKDILDTVKTEIRTAGVEYLFRKYEKNKRYDVVALESVEFVEAVESAAETEIAEDSEHDQSFAASATDAIGVESVVKQSCIPLDTENVSKVNRNRKKVEEVYEGLADSLTDLEELTVSETIQIASGETLVYKKKNIYCQEKIICEGSLVFEQCILRYKKGLDFARVQINAGKLTLKECIVKYDDSQCEDNRINDSEGDVDANIYDSLIEAQNANICLKSCCLVGAKNLIRLKNSDILVTDCVGIQMEPSFIYAQSSSKVKVNSCSMVANAAPINPVQVQISFDLPRALIMTPLRAEIIDSTFEGFMDAVLWQNKHTIIRNSKFYECLIASSMRNRDSNIRVEHCEFEKCYDLFTLGEGSKLCLTNCEINDCYGKIQADEIVCVECHWNGGLSGLGVPSYEDGSGQANLTHCKFQGIQYDTALKHLKEYKTNGFSYIFFRTEGEIEEFLDRIAYNLINVGNHGTISGSEFYNIDTRPANHLISCSKSMSIENCVFENCSSAKGLLDEDIHEVLSGALRERFFGGRKYKASYFITRCQGLR